MRDIFRVTWLGLAVLTIPLGFALRLISNPTLLGLERLFSEIPGGDYHVNVVLLILMSASQVTLFLMLVAFFFEAYAAAFAYRGDDRLVRVISTISLVFLGIMCVGLCLYLGLVIAVFRQRGNASVEELFAWGRLILLATFSTFLVLDIVLWGVAKRAVRECARQAQAPNLTPEAQLESSRALALSDNDRAFARACALLIDIPVLLVAGGALLLGYMLIVHGRYDAFYDTGFVTRGLPGRMDREVANLFINGLEVGITIALMIFSQIEFLFLKAAWALRRSSVIKSALQQAATS